MFLRNYRFSVRYSLTFRYFIINSMRSQIQKAKIGRPPAIKEDTVRKLEVCLASGYSITTACYFSGVSRSTYYEYLAMDKDFSDKMRMAEEASTFRARQVILQAIDSGDIKAAQWWLERKAKSEFAAFPASMVLASGLQGRLYRLDLQSV